MKKSILILELIAFLVTNSNAQTVIDYDGNIYHTVTIGTQVWLKENLKVTHYRNGDSIPNITDNMTWENYMTGAYCDYYNIPNNGLIYGKLYNRFAIIDIRSIAPNGWHISTDKEWTILADYIGGDSIATGKLKEAGFTHWESPNFGATNETGFTALPGGFIDGYTFLDEGNFGYWWTSNKKFGICMSYVSLSLIGIGCQDNYGLSVRCIKDSSTQINDIINQREIKIYPNPATDKIYYYCSERQDIKMQVFNSIGECVIQKEFNNVTNTIDISTLTKGIYILKFTSPNGTIEKKLIKE